MEKLKLLAKSLKHICGGIHFSKVEDFEPKYLLKDELANGIFQEFRRDYKQLFLTFQNSKISYIPEHISLTLLKESLGQAETII